MKTNNAGIELIKRFEGLRTEAYLCSANVWTIGYGTTTAAGVVTVRRGMTITAEAAEAFLVRSLAKYEAGVMKALTRAPNENQFSAMVSFCYNVGPAAFARSSVAKKFNAGDAIGAANALRLWNKADGRVLEGLVRRREAERKLFFTDVKKSGQSIPPPPDVEPPAPAPAPEAVGWLAALIKLLLSIFRRTP
jgi:lysozyme